MITFSQFTSHYLDNQSRMPPAVAAEIRREALARVIKRQQAGRATTFLLFDDLVERIERSIGGV